MPDLECPDCEKPFDPAQAKWAKSGVRLICPHCKNKSGRPPRRHKYNVGPKEERTRDGILFDSIMEADFYEELKLQLRAGVIISFERQAPFDLPGGRKYLLDFMVVTADGDIHYYDVKGATTQVYRLKKAMVQDIYGITIEEVQPCRR